jgi:peptide/nickel transport system substrate-binding protein
MKSKWFIVIAAVLAAALLIGALAVRRYGPSDASADLPKVKEGSAEAVNKDADRKNTLVIYAEDVTGSANPVYAQSSGDQAVSRIIFEPLMEKDENGVYQPYLANSLEISDDGLSYTIQLQEHVLFSDGSEMTAGDVIASIAAMGLSEYAGSAAEAYSNISGMEEFAVNPEELPIGLASDGDYTVKVRFIKASPDNLLILGTRIQKDTFTDSWDDLQPGSGIGTGAYQMTEVTSGSLASLTVNESYRKSVKDIQKIEFASVDYYDTDTDVEDSGLDVIRYSGNSLLYDIFYDWDGFSVYTEAQDTVYTMFYNQNNAALTNRKVRQAIACAIDRESAAEQIQGTSFTLDEGVGPDLCGTDLPTTYSYDVARAKELLEEAKEEMPDLAYGISLKLPILKDSEVHAVLAQVIQTDLQEIGIQVDVTELDQQAYMKSLYLSMDFDLYLAGMTITDSVDSYRNLYELSGMPVNVEDEGIDAAFEALSASVTQEQVSANRKALYDAIEEAQPSLILGRSRNYISVSADLSGYGIGSYEDFLGQIYRIRVE